MEHDTTGGSVPQVKGERPPVGQPVFEVDASTGALAKLVLKNALLSLLSLSIYRFWGKTEIRRYLWSHVKLNGDRLEYTGTGKELFLGFAFVTAVVIVPMVLVNHAIMIWLAPTNPGLAMVLNLVWLAVIFFLVPVAIYRAWRYRLSRTRWRGIRFSLGGSAFRYGVKSFLYSLAMPFTMSWIYPWQVVGLWKYQWGNTRLGTQSFAFRGKGGDLFGWYVGLGMLAGLAAVVALGAATAVLGAEMDATMAAMQRQIDAGENPADIGWVGLAGFAMYAIWGLVFGLIFMVYKAREFSYLASGMRFGGMVVRAKFPYGGAVRLVVGNFLLTVFSLGLLAPLASLRTLRFIAAHTTMAGNFDFATLEQGAEDAMRTGEGLAEAFDPGAI